MARIEKGRPLAGPPLYAFASFARILVEQQGALFHLVQELVGTLGLVGHFDLGFHVAAVAGTSRDEAAHDDVFLKTAQLI